MKKRIFIFIFLLSLKSLAQQAIFEDSLRAIINNAKGGTTTANVLSMLTDEQMPYDSAIKYATHGILLAKKFNYKKGEADCYLILARTTERQNNFSQAIKYSLEALNIYEGLRDTVSSALVQMILHGCYRQVGDFKKALDIVFRGYMQMEKSNTKGTLTFAGFPLGALYLAEIAQTYILYNKPDSASFYAQKAIDENALFNGAKWNFPVYLLATTQYMQGKYRQCLENFRSAIPLAIQNGFFGDTLQIFSGMSTLFLKTGQFDSAIYYAQMVVHSTNPKLEIKNLIEAVSNLEQVYKLTANKDSTIKYVELRHQLKDSIFSKEKDREIQNITFNEQLKRQEILSYQARYKSKVQLYSLATGLFVLLLIAAILWRNNRQKQKAKLKIEHAYFELKSTQSQLIQSEKMASLGELTAGIAHEIQNPLNFVNNFSEVNKELLAEMKDEMNKGNLDDATSIANDVIANEEKINHHGKRADAIVKGMLQHSRSSSGVKEPTNINALADEYLRLAYHGLKAKDKSFIATMKTDFDESIGKINIIPQDIGRVLLNLYNNAFYASSAKALATEDAASLPSKGGFSDPDKHHDPAIWLSTKKMDDKVFISVKDNGPGIPQKILDKIFQPFFTTKPTGQGTGLGLSLSYDIVKAHGGELKVESKEGEGAEFVILLPVV